MYLLKNIFIMLLNMRKVLYQEIINPEIILQKNRENE